MTNNCEICGVPVARKPNKNSPARFCSHACYWESMRGAKFVERVSDVRSRRVYDHPIAPRSGIVPVARLVLYDKIGPGPHTCHWCGCEIDWRPNQGVGASGALISDHLNFDKDDNRPENLVASCNSCNCHRTRRGDRRRIEEGEPFLMVNSPNGPVRTRAVEQECAYCGAKFLALPASVRAGKARYCSYACGRHWNEVRKRSA